jgi:hypothetical protein
MKDTVLELIDKAEINLCERNLIIIVNEKLDDIGKQIEMCKKNNLHKELTKKKGEENLLKQIIGFLEEI